MKRSYHTPVGDPCTVCNLPQGGPDRVRLCLWYSDALDCGKSHDDALEYARSLLRLLHMYSSAGIANKLGDLVGGIPPEYIGED